MSVRNEYNQEEYYDTSEFKEANVLFEEFLSRCTYITSERKPQVDFSISTMTVVTNFCDEINVRQVFQRLSLDDDIAYIESGKQIRGIRKKQKSTYKKKNKKKKTNDKRKLGKGNPFSNQMSIGFKCNECSHVHNNPICVKIFQNGKVHMTGCKNIEEVERVYNKLYQKIKNIKSEYILNGKKIIINPVKNIKEFKDITVKTEMINGTFSTNFKIDLNKMLCTIQDKYTDEEIYINNEKKSPLMCYLKIFEVFDEKKQKNKIPSVFVYNSGAINIISINYEIIMKAYNFMSKFIEDNYDNIIESQIQFDDTFFN